MIGPIKIPSVLLITLSPIFHKSLILSVCYRIAADLIGRDMDFMKRFFIIIVIAPIYIPGNSLAVVCKWLLLIPLTAMLILCVRYTAGRYFVDID